MIAKPKTYTEKEVVEMILTLREELSDLEHQQWESWSRYVANDLLKINKLAVIERWRINWIPYSELNEKTKDSDRIWADKIIKLINSKFMTVAGFRKSIEDAGLVGASFHGSGNKGGKQ